MVCSLGGKSESVIGRAAAALCRRKRVSTRGIATVIQRPAGPIPAGAKKGVEWANVWSGRATERFTRERAARMVTTPWQRLGVVLFPRCYPIARRVG